VADGRVALVGDAAYMVDSLSGEGIFYALKAGRIAADSVVEALETEQSDLQHYQSAIDETVMKELKWSARLASVFFKFPRKCYEHGVKRTAIVNLIKRVVRSEESYDEIYGALWDEIKQRLSPSSLGELAFR
jgi:flavin-dependent dehydrogenase